LTSASNCIRGMDRGEGAAGMQKGNQVLSGVKKAPAACVPSGPVFWNPDAGKESLRE
jgi:hypothetical protein